MMKLRKVDDRTWVNVGLGNITSVVDNSHTPGRFDVTLINFVGGGQLEIARDYRLVIKDLEDDRGFGR